MVRKAISLLLTILLLSGCSASEERELTIGAAANLTNALTEIAQPYSQETGCKVRLHFAASGQIAHQVREGAPLDLVILANVAYVDQLEREGLVLPDTKRIYARGRLVIWTRDKSGLKVDKLQDLADPEVDNIAIANPEHAPYGMAAREALKSAGLWEAVKSKIVYGENVRQALQYAQTGDADVALVPLSLVVNLEGHYSPVPEELHGSLDQALAVVKGTENEKAARDFIAFLTGPEGRRILERYGYIVPEEGR